MIRSTTNVFRRPLSRDSARILVNNIVLRRLSDEAAATMAFDRQVKKQQRNNAARSHSLWRDSPGYDGYDYIKEEIAARLVDRLDDIKRDEGFPLALDLGAGAGFVRRSICAEEALQGQGGIGGVRKLVQLDSAPEMLNRDADVSFPHQDRCETYRLESDEEAKLPFPDGTFDLVISSAALHWVNALPKLFSEVSRVLKPDGCFMFALIGGNSLPELRASMVLAEIEREGGVSTHVGPFVELSDVGSLMQRAGFSLPTIDVDTITVAFPNATVLMEHLQRMGENNAGLKRRERISLDTFIASACLYDDMFPLQANSDDEDAIEASLQVIYAIGWTPHGSQQTPLTRGSATHKVGDIVEEHKAK